MKTLRIAFAAADEEKPVRSHPAEREVYDGARVAAAGQPDTPRHMTMGTNNGHQ